MRKILTLIVGFSLLVTVSVSAQEQEETTTSPTVLIDFSTLDEGGNAPTLGFEELFGGNFATSLFSEDEKAAIQASLFLYPREREEDNRWRVELASSSRRVAAVRKSGVQSVPVTRTVEGFAEAGENVLGVRVFFPDGNFNGWALLRPPFTIPFGDSRFVEFGLIENVSEIEYINLTIYGLNHPHGVSVVLEDQAGTQKEYFMGFLNFTGWRTMTWRNTQYLGNINKRTLEESLPVYPNLTNRMRLVGVRFYRSSEVDGGDLVTYIKDVSVGYERQSVTALQDFDHEDQWQIEATQDRERHQAESRRLGNTELLRFLERGRQQAGQQPQ